MEMEDVRDKIVLAALSHVVFDGWTIRSLRSGAVDAGFEAGIVAQVFPLGVVEAVEHFFALGDRRMVADLASTPFGDRRPRERLAIALRCRLEPWTRERDAVRRAVSLLALPPHAAAAARCTHRTVDAVWYAVGDTATDFTYYTKRGMLAAVYITALMYWLGDGSDDSADTWNFIDRRTAGMTGVSQLRERIGRGLMYIPNPLRIFRPKKRGGRREVGPMPDFEL
ncbi:MAG: COQ9 family protein [Alphaproteobacteria bacterium]|nr:COQ9 family protein [Alphaproteobacteria bacterium]